MNNMMMTNDDEEYQRTLVWATGVIVLKNFFNHILAVRARLATGILGDNIDAPPQEGWDSPRKPKPLFYWILLSFVGPLRSRQSLKNLISMENNAAQNETFFLLAAIVWGLQLQQQQGGQQPQLPGWAVPALRAYVYSRFVHMAFYLNEIRQPFRAFSWQAGALIMVAMAVNAMMTTAVSSKPSDGSNEL